MQRTDQRDHTLQIKTPLTEVIVSRYYSGILLKNSAIYPHEPLHIAHFCLLPLHFHRGYANIANEVEND